MERYLRLAFRRGSGMGPRTCGGKGGGMPEQPAWERGPGQRQGIGTRVGCWMGDWSWSRCWLLFQLKVKGKKISHQ